VEVTERWGIVFWFLELLNCASVPTPIAAIGHQHILGLVGGAIISPTRDRLSAEKVSAGNLFRRSCQG